MGRASSQCSADARAKRRPARRNGTRAPYWWSDERLEAELRAFTEGLTEFPTLIDFDAAGRGDLRSAINELGGSAYWAKVIGLPLPPSRLRAKYKLSDAIRDAHQVISELGYLPGEPTLRRMKYGQLATYVRRTPGGATAFAAKHGLIVTARAASQRS